MIDNPQEYEIMAAVETNHWWYRALHSQVLEALQSQIKSQGIDLLDAGCGTGGLMQTLTRAGYRNLKGFDLSPFAVEICRKSGLVVQVGDLSKMELIYAPQMFDAIVSNDTLYYLTSEQQQAFLRGAFARLNSGGLLIMNVPALAVFRGRHDHAVGITHRFNRREVKSMIKKTEFELVTLRYWPLTVAPAIFLVRAWQRLVENSGSSVKSASDLKEYSEKFNASLYRLICLELRYMQYAPFGSSLFTVLKRPLV